jgi:hypothetical protein
MWPRLLKIFYRAFKHNTHKNSCVHEMVMSCCSVINSAGNYLRELISISFSKVWYVEIINFQEPIWYWHTISSSQVLSAASFPSLLRTSPCMLLFVSPQLTNVYTYLPSFVSSWHTTLLIATDVALPPSLKFWCYDFFSIKNHCTNFSSKGCVGNSLV